MTINDQHYDSPKPIFKKELFGNRFASGPQHVRPDSGNSPADSRNCVKAT